MLAAIPKHLLFQALTPTEAEMRDAIARVTRDLEDMRVKRGSEWEPHMETFQFSISVTDEGETVLRGTIGIERKD